MGIRRSISCILAPYFASFILGALLSQLAVVRRETTTSRNLRANPSAYTPIPSAPPPTPEKESLTADAKFILDWRKTQELQNRMLSRPRMTPRERLIANGYDPDIPIIWTYFHSHEMMPGYLKVFEETCKKVNKDLQYITVTPELAASILPDDTHWSLFFLENRDIADVMRALTLRDYGGFYMDKDTICARPLNEIYDLSMAEHEVTGYGEGGVIGHGVFGPFRPNSEFATKWAAAINEKMEKNVERTLSCFYLPFLRETTMEEMAQDRLIKGTRECGTWGEFGARVDTKIMDEIAARNSSYFGTALKPQIMWPPIREWTDVRYAKYLSRNPSKAPAPDPDCHVMIFNNAMYTDHLRSLSMDEFLQWDQNPYAELLSELLN